MLLDILFNFTKNSKYDRYQRGLATMIDKFFDRKYATANTSANTRTVRDLS